MMQTPIAPVLLLSLFSVLTVTVSAQEKKPNLNQYKRLHQDALAKIVQGEVEAAKNDLLAVLERLPEDAESHYMLAVAHTKQGNFDAAVAEVQAAVTAGLPVSRFVTGTKTGLEPLRELDAFQAIVQAPENLLAHGPMLGRVSGNGISVWVRTAGIKQVSVTATDTQQNQSIVSAAQLTSAAADHTAVITLDSLQPNTGYTYQVKIANADGSDPQTYDGGAFKTLVADGAPVKFRLTFGGGAGFVPQHEHMWNTIRQEKPDLLLLLGDNVYSDAPKSPDMQHYCYYRRQSRPEFRALVAQTPTYTIWDDHDFGTNDCSGGPEILQPAWKLPVYRVFRNNWVNPYYGGGESQPGCYYDFSIGNVHFVMLDGRYYRNLNDTEMPTMLGPVQRQWLLQTIEQSTAKLLVLCSPVPWVFEAKGDSKDTWNGFQAERNLIFDFLDEHKKEGVVLMSADRHRSDLWKIPRQRGYPLYELNSSRLTNQHVHAEMPAAMFSYNKKQSFGTVDFDTTIANPSITYRVISIDGEEVHRHTVRFDELSYRGE